MSSPRLIPINIMARRLRVTVGWLRAEADAGRIPHLKAGNQILVHPTAVTRALAERAGATGAAEPREAVNAG